MKTKTLQKKTVGRKGCFLALIIAACFLIAAPPLAAQQGQQGYGDQQGEKGYGGQQGEQQQYQQRQYQDPAQQQPANFSEENLQKYAEARETVNDIRNEYSNALSDVEDPKKAQKLQNKYTQKMIDAIEGEDLSVSKYNDIGRAIQDDPKLQKKVENLSN